MCHTYVKNGCIRKASRRIWSEYQDFTVRDRKKFREFINKWCYYWTKEKQI
jgi:hypothetical protein